MKNRLLAYQVFIFVCFCAEFVLNHVIGENTVGYLRVLVPSIGYKCYHLLPSPPPMRESGVNPQMVSSVYTRQYLALPPNKSIAT